MKMPASLLILLTTAIQISPAHAPVYAESFRQGSTQIVEESFEVRLTPHDPVYRERIKDLHGADRYVFSVVPQGPEGDTRITSWRVKLADLRHPIYENVLMASQEPSGDPKNALWRLEPGTYAQVPVSARRVIKVDGFYVALQVKQYHFTPPDSPYLDSMTVTVTFTNTDPRKSDTSTK